MRRGHEDPFAGLGQGGGARVGTVGRALEIPAFDPHRAASRAATRFDVAPAVADHVRGGELEIQLAGGTHEHPRFRLAARTSVRVVVIARVQTVEGKRGADRVVDRLDRGARRRPARDVRLVGDDDHAETALVQPLDAARRVRLDAQLGERRRRMRPPVAKDRRVDDAVAVEEDRGAHADRATASHFVAAALSAGCVTSRCHTTPWNASECGVTCAALTVGMITHASATFAV